MNFQINLLSSFFSQIWGKQDSKERLSDELLWKAPSVSVTVDKTQQNVAREYALYREKPNRMNSIDITTKTHSKQTAFPSDTLAEPLMGGKQPAALLPAILP